MAVLGVILPKSREEEFLRKCDCLEIATTPAIPELLSLRPVLDLFLEVGGVLCWGSWIWRIPYLT